MDRTPIHLAPLVSYQKPQESPCAVVPVLVVGNKLRAKGVNAMVTAKQQTLDSLPDFFSVDAFAQVIGLSRASAYRLTSRPGFLACGSAGGSSSPGTISGDGLTGAWR